jgi:hypothetical protein
MPLAIAVARMLVHSSIRYVMRSTDYAERWRLAMYARYYVSKPPRKLSR